MLAPRCYFADDFRQFSDYFLPRPHVSRRFEKGQYLWKSGQVYERSQHLISGAVMHCADHGSGRRKMICEA